MYVIYTMRIVAGKPGYDISMPQVSRQMNVGPAGSARPQKSNQMLEPITLQHGPVKALHGSFSPSFSIAFRRVQTHVLSYFFCYFTVIWKVTLK